MEELNDISILGADAHNTFLMVPNCDKCYLISWTYFGLLRGKKIIVAREIYGLNSSGASFKFYIISKLDDMGFK